MQQGHMQLNIILHLHNYEFLIYNLKDKYVKEKGICNRSMDSAIWLRNKRSLKLGDDFDR